MSTYNHISSTPANTNTAGPLRYILLMIVLFILKLTDSPPPAVRALTLYNPSSLPHLLDMAAAVTPVPHERVSFSTPLSYVRTNIPSSLRSTKFTFVPPGANFSEYLTDRPLSGTSTFLALVTYMI